MYGNAYRNPLANPFQNPYDRTLTGPAFQGLLDTYSGSALAVSMRLLRAGHAGPCMRVRRSSDNLEADIPFSPIIVGGHRWIDEAALLAHVGSGTGFVAVWYDQSGRGWDASTATAAQQPIIVNAGVIDRTSSGRPTVEFTGGRRLYIYGGASICRLVDYTACYSVYERLSAADQVIFSCSVGSGNLTRMLAQATVSSMQAGGRRLDANAFSSNTQSLGGLNFFQTVAEVRYGLGQHEAFVNTSSSGATALSGGAGFTSDTDSSVTPGIGISTTGGVAANGYIPEVVIYTTSDVSMPKRTAISTNQITAFGVL